MGKRWRRLRTGRSRSFRGYLSRAFVVRLVGAGVATGGLALIGVGTVGAPVFSNGVALQAAGGTNNKEDVWLANVGTPPGAGHSHEPHLACTDINIWGHGMTQSSGTYSIDGQPPSGTGTNDVAYGPEPWNYDTTAAGDQVISVINVTTLYNNALANGDTAAKQGLHFKIQLLQSPYKHKTFWVNCAAPPTTTTTSSTTTSSTTSSTTSTAPGSTTSSQEPTTSTTSSPGAGVLGAATTPSTGADVEFGLGLGLMIGGGAVAFGSGPLFRRLKR